MINREIQGVFEQKHPYIFARLKRVGSYLLYECTKLTDDPIGKASQRLRKFIQPDKSEKKDPDLVDHTGTDAEDKCSRYYDQSQDSNIHLKERLEKTPQDLVIKQRICIYQICRENAR